MIDKVTIARFGKFASRTFPLGAVTFFTGTNESGKTTLFDALFEALCRPGGATSYGKNLRKRYGEDRAVEVNPPGSKPFMDPEEFMNVHAIRSGDMDVDFAQGAKWTEKVKASLFSGGVDPRRIKLELVAEASDKGATRQMRARKLRADELATARQDLAQLEARRKEVLAVERKTNEDELNKLTAAISQDKEKIAGLDRILAQQKAIRDLDEGKNVLTLLRDTHELEKDLSGQAPDRVRNEANLSALEEVTRAAQGKLDRALGAKDNAEKDLREQREKVLRLEKSSREQAPIASLSARLSAELTALMHARSAPPSIGWNPLMLALAGIAILAGVMCAILIDVTMTRFLLGALGIAAGVILAFFARKAPARVHDSAMLVELKRIRDEWAASAGDARALQGETPEGLVAQLRRGEAERDAASGRLLDEKSELARRESVLDELRAQLNGLRNEQAQADAGVRKWLEERGARSATEYRENAKELVSREQTLRQSLAQRDAFLRKWNCADAAALKSECISRIETLEKKITDSRLPDPDVKLRESEMAALRKDVEQREAHRVRLVQEVSESKGIVKGSLAGIPEQIVQVERRIYDCEGEIAEMDLVRKASECAAEMFGEIERNAGAVFFGLTKDIGSLFGEILPEARDIVIEDLGLGSINVQDAGGTARTLDNLSQGTRDSFWFAARLALSVRAAPDGGLLLLDEPFLSLDAEREGGALRMLKSFQEKKKRQVIIFGKEKRLAERLRGLFPDLLVHDLES